MPPRSTARNTGYIPDEFDERDKTYYYRGEKRSAQDFEEANLWKDHPEWLQQIYDQHKSGSCVANATAAAVRYLSYRAADEEDGSTLSVDPSRLFIYYNARATQYMDRHAAEGRGWPPADAIGDSGTTNRAAMKAINQFGIAPEEAWPFLDQNETVLGLNDRPPEAAYASAPGVRAFQYYRLDPDNEPVVRKILTPDERHAVGRVTLARLKQCLVEGYPVVFGFNFYWDPDEPQWVGKDKDVPKNKGDEVYESLPEINPKYADKPPPRFHGKVHGHAILAVGFENRHGPGLEHLGGGRVLCLNSWGSDSQALFWMSYNWILEYWATDDFWMVRQLSTSSDAPPPSALDLPQGSTWGLLSDMPRKKEAAAAAAGSSRRRRTVAMASYGGQDLAFGAWWISPDGSLQGADYTPAPGKLGGPPPASGSASSKESGDAGRWYRYKISGRAAVGSGIAASAVLAPKDRDRDAHHCQVDVVWIDGTNGSIQAAANIAGYFNYFYEVAPAESASLTSPLSHLFRDGERGSGEVAYLGGDGAVCWASRRHQGGLWRQREVAPAESAANETGLAIASTGADHVAIFWTDKSGTVWGRTWKETTEGEGDWVGPPYAVSDEGEAARSSCLAAVSRPGRDGHASGVDVLFVTVSGILALRSGLSTAASGEWESRLPKKNEKNEAVPDKFRARVDSDIRAVVVGEGDAFEVVWTGPDNSLQSARVSESSIDVEAVLQSGGVAAGSPLGAVSVAPRRLWTAFRSYGHELVFATHETH